MELVEVQGVGGKSDSCTSIGTSIGEGQRREHRQSTLKGEGCGVADGEVWDGFICGIGGKGGPGEGAGSVGVEEGAGGTLGRGPGIGDATEGGGATDGGGAADLEVGRDRSVVKGEGKGTGGHGGVGVNH